MRRCTTCFRYAAGHPAYCPWCGRTYNVKLCPRGHANLRSVQFCAQCGSAELSTPAAPEGLLARVSRLVMVGCVVVLLSIVLVAIAASIVASVDWKPIIDRIALLGLLLAFVYWCSTLLPGPVKKVGKAVGRKAVRAMRNRRKDR